MIFATIGNDHRQFLRFNQLVLIINDLLPNEKIFYQNGYTPFNSNIPNISNKDFIKREEFNTFLKNSSVVFTHAGAGTLLQLTKLKKVPLVLPRLVKFKEHLDNHQKETLNEFKKLKFALEIDYPFCEKELKKKINISQDFEKVKSSQKSNFRSNALINCIKKDVEHYLQK